jgi:lysophospholipase L1-like esterase
MKSWDNKPSGRYRRRSQPRDRRPRLRSHFSPIPLWAWLSLVLNGLLFASMLLITLDSPHPAATPPLGPEIVTEAQALEPLTFTPEMGTRHQLAYQQWVDLLAQEAQAAAVRQPDRLTVLLGDSISLWFPPDLLPGRRTWLNQGISGDDSAGLLARLSLLDDTQPETIFIMIGINDLIRGTSEETVLDNYRQTLIYLQQQHPQTQLVVQSILPHSAEQSTWEGRERLLALPNEQIMAVNQQIQEIAVDYGAYFLDLYPLMVTGEGYLRPDLSTDGLHLNEQGYIVWRTAIALFSQTQLEASP